MKTEFGSDFFFVNRFPSKVKPFYVMRVDEDPRYARSVDMVYKGLELSSGGQREHRHERSSRRYREKGMDEEGAEVVHRAVQVRRAAARGVLAGHREVHRSVAQHRERQGGCALPKRPREAATVAGRDSRSGTSEPHGGFALELDHELDALHLLHYLLEELDLAREPLDPPAGDYRLCELATRRGARRC